MGSMSLMHWIIVLLVFALLFGTSRLRSAGEDLGMAIRGFKNGLKEGEKGSETPKNDSTPSS